MEYKHSFSHSAKTCLEESEKLAVQLGHTQLDTAHVLLALIGCFASKAFIVLESLGVSSYDVGKELKSIHPPIGQFVKNLEPSEELFSAIEKASRMARERGLDHITPEDLLVAILSSEEFTAYKVISNLEFQPEAIISETISN